MAHTSNSTMNIFVTKRRNSTYARGGVIAAAIAKTAWLMGG